MAVASTWRRDLYPAENRVDLIQLDEKWATAETTFVDSVTPIFNQVLDKLLADIKFILESNNYSELKNIKVGYKDKLINVVRQSIYDSFKIGKSSVYQEFSISGDIVIDAKNREYFNAKAEAVVSDILDRVRSNTIFLVLAGIKSGKTIQQILQDVRGPAYQPEPRLLAEQEGMRELIGRAVSTAALINVAEGVNVGRASGFNDIIDQIGAWQWSAILDSKTCEICEELDGKYFEKGDTQWEQLQPPAHPGCRCIAVAVLNEELDNFPVKYTYYSQSQIDELMRNKFW